MSKHVLRESKGGYKKVAVITKLDAYNCLITAIEQGGMSRRQVLNELERIRRMELPTEKKGLFGTPGFSVDDTDSFMEECENKIMNNIEDLY
jgi:hypothetical protein